MSALALAETNVTLYIADPSLPALSLVVRGSLTLADRERIAAAYSRRRPRALRQRAYDAAMRRLQDVTVEAGHVATRSPGIDPDDIPSPARVW